MVIFRREWECAILLCLVESFTIFNSRENQLQMVHFPPKWGNLETNKKGGFHMTRKLNLIFLNPHTSLSNSMTNHQTSPMVRSTIAGDNIYYCHQWLCLLLLPATTTTNRPMFFVITHTTFITCNIWIFILNFIVNLSGLSHDSIFWALKSNKL